MPNKTYVCSEETDKKIKEVAQYFELSNNGVIDIAVNLFLAVSVENRRKLVSEFHRLRNEALNQDQRQSLEDEILSLFDVSGHLEEIRKRRKQSHG